MKKSLVLFGSVTDLLPSQTYVRIRIKCPVYLIGQIFFNELCYMIGSRDLHQIHHTGKSLEFLVPLNSGIRLLQLDQSESLTALKTKYKIETITCDQDLDIGLNSN